MCSNEHFSPQSPNAEAGTNPLFLSSEGPGLRKEGVLPSWIYGETQSVIYEAQDLVRGARGEVRLFWNTVDGRVGNAEQGPPSRDEGALAVSWKMLPAALLGATGNPPRATPRATWKEACP